MKYAEDLTSGKTSLVKKAAKKILKERLTGYGALLHQALAIEMDKPKSWESQMYLIYAMAATNCIDEISYLKSLILRNIPTPVTYRSLALAIVYLENSEIENLSFVYESLESNNFLQAAGACAAIYMKKIVLKDDDFNKIMTYITKDIYLENLRGTIAPFMYILAASYLYPENNRKKIVDFSRQFNEEHINTLINDVLKGKDGKRICHF
ncbi:hypothetical protein [Haemophilus parainfluenzae]|jgi:hypothetical protein|uniref:HEAT repeat domain-containing protein n=1 Tax=Haemophilus parainfluenzae TaxID=729 RepID=A0A7M1NVJ1_HAEPA|nr:hypothetical protein [Haemophilus parainfluenzae]QOR16966.1 hypothetical protein INP94_08860 [Haemophilus parainfluenzae]